VIFHSYVKLPEGNHYHHGFHQICVLPAERSARHPAPQQHWALEAPRAPGASVSVGFVPGKWRFQHGVAMKNVDFMGCLAMDKW
jgi:hypothetical protein